jgi:predicted Abi (CAAX) family protease
VKRLSLSAPLALVLASLGAACTAPIDDADLEASVDSEQAVADDPQLYRPVAEWSGRLVLPKAAERRADGAVRFVVRNAPSAHRALIGKTVWLSMPTALRIDVALGDSARQAEAAGNVIPRRLDGWKRVSPLESLAGPHANDDVDVALFSPTVVGAELRIAKEPMIIEGERVALVRIDKVGPGGRVTVRHFGKSATKPWSGPLHTIGFEAPARAEGSPIDGMQSSPLAADGYYVYGRFVGTDFRVTGLQPRAVRKLVTSSTRVGADATKLHVGSETWSNPGAQKGKASLVGLFPAGTRDPQAALGQTFREGAEGLVLHLFGGIGPKEAKPVVTGHFAFGTSKIVRDPFTNELQVDVVYKQVYAHNPNGIVSGTVHWSAYDGAFKNGWQYARPISNIVLQHPALTRSYDLAGVKFRPLDGLANDLELMTARYRVGNGTGVANVTPATSCVQDSSQALFIALSRLRQNVTSVAAVRTFIANNPNDPQVRDFRVVEALADELAAFLQPLGYTRSDWASRAADVASVNGCPGARAGEVACALATYNTIFPRHANDRYARFLLDAGASGLVVRTNQIVASYPSITPLAPTSPTAR